MQYKLLYIKVCWYMYTEITVWFIVMCEALSVFLLLQSNTRGTVKDKANFKADEDVSALRTAIEGIGRLTISVLWDKHIQQTYFTQPVS